MLYDAYFSYIYTLPSEYIRVPSRQLLEFFSILSTVGINYEQRSSRFPKGIAIVLNMAFEVSLKPVSCDRKATVASVP